MAVKITDRAIDMRYATPIPASCRSATDPECILFYDEKGIKKYLQYGKIECAASDLNNSNKQHQFETK